MQATASLASPSSQCRFLARALDASSSLSSAIGSALRAIYVHIQAQSELTSVGAQVVSDRDNAAPRAI